MISRSSFVAVLTCSQGYGQTGVVASPSSAESSQRGGFDRRSDTDPALHPSDVDRDEPPGAHEAHPAAEVSSRGLHTPFEILLQPQYKIDG